MLSFCIGSEHIFPAGGAAMEGPHGMLPPLIAVISAAGGSIGFLKRGFQVTLVSHLLLVFLLLLGTVVWVPPLRPPLSLWKDPEWNVFYSHNRSSQSHSPYPQHSSYGLKRRFVFVFLSIVCICLLNVMYVMHTSTWHVYMLVC